MSYWLTKIFTLLTCKSTMQFSSVLNS